MERYPELGTLVFSIFYCPDWECYRYERKTFDQKFDHWGWDNGRIFLTEEEVIFQVEYLNQFID